MSFGLLQAIAGHPGPLALCTVMQVKGSGPRHAGSKMLVGQEGRLQGSVGGGRGEALALAACQDALQSGVPRVLDIDMQGTEAEGPAMLCGGTSRLLVEPLASRVIYLSALERLCLGRPALLVKRLDTGDTALMDEQGAWIGAPLKGADPRAAGQALDTGFPVLGETEGLLYDPLLPAEKLLILGGGYVGQALAALAPGLGFQVTVGDDRPAFLEPDRFPAGVGTLVGAYADILAGFPSDGSTFIVIVTRGHLSDLECVRGVLAKPYHYAGLMGSLRKVRLVLDLVAGEGFDPQKVEALCAPLGLEIGAETPEELAVAIAGELIAARRNSATFEATHRLRKARRQDP